MSSSHAQSVVVIAISLPPTQISHTQNWHLWALVHISTSDIHDICNKVDADDDSLETTSLYMILAKALFIPALSPG